MQRVKKRHALIRPGTRGQGGFSLVELMVALVIGLIIILGAGQLFLTGFFNFRQVQLLGEKQSALTYATETVVRDIRRAKEISVDVNGLLLTVANRGDMADTTCGIGSDVVKRYAVKTDGGEHSLKVSVGCGAEAAAMQPIASGFHPDGFSASETSSGVWQLTFNLLSDSRDSSQRDVIIFHAVNRTAAMQNFGS